MPWIRLDTEIDDSARFDDLDGYGRAIYLWVLRRAKKSRGKMSDHNWRADFIARRTGFEDQPERVAFAMATLTAPGSLLEHADGWVHVIGWSRYQLDPTAAERQDNYRESKKPNEVAETVTANPVADRDIPKSRLRDRTGQDNTGQVGSARPRDRIEYEGEQTTDAQRIVAAIVARWDNWPQCQVEPSVMRLRQADPGLSLKDWMEIIDEAFRTCPPDRPTNQLHSWLARQVTIWKRERERTPLPTGPASASHREFAPDPDESRPEARTPEEQAEIDAARATALAAMAGLVASTDAMGGE